MIAVFAVIAAIVLHLVAQAGMLFTRPEWAISSFRLYFPFDQLSYMSMVANASRGDYAAAEPFTGTGSNFYPRAWYLLLGTVARLFDLHPATAWQLGGLAVQALLVGTLAVTIIILSGRPWLGLLAPVPFVLGTFAFARLGEWFTPMDSHAVLWGPFGVLYTLNGEAASLSLAGVALCVLLLAWGRESSRRSRIALTLVSAAVIGFLANVQTYSFITVVYLVSTVASAWAIARWRNSVVLVISVLLLPTLFIVGPALFERFGQLPTLVFGLLPTAPGLVLLLLKTGPIIIAYFGTAVVAAAPQLVSTALGIAADDPFLAYRVASNRNLGVEPVPGLLGAVALLLPLVALLVAGILQRRALWIAYPAGSLTTWFLLATNDRWGPNAEPYRLWIDSFLLIAVGLMPLLLGALTEIFRVTTGGVASGRLLRLSSIAVTSAIVIVATVSSLDWVRFYTDDEYHGTVSFTDARGTALGELAERSEDGSGALLAVDTCIDPQIVKLNSAAPVAFYNLGMAWPEERDAVQRYLADRAELQLSVPVLERAGIGWLLTDSACQDGWSDQLAVDLDRVDTLAYGTGEISLWKLRSP